MSLLRLFAILLVALPVAASAQDAAAPTGAISLSAPGKPAVTLSANEIGSLPAVSKSVTFKTSKGQESGTYEGTLLWALLDSKGVLSFPAHNEELRHTLLVTGRDGYAIAFSVGEIAPDFGARDIILATKSDGKPLVPGGGFRLVVPGDARGARNVEDVMSIEVK